MNRREKDLLTVLMAAVGLVWLILLPGCPVRNLTGIPCPGCGMSRAWWAWLRLDVDAAFAYHPMFWAVPVFFWLFRRDFRPFRRSGANLALVLGLAAGLVGCWWFRLYFGLIK